MPDWQAFPKVELHLHLEGACPVDFARQIAHTKSIELGSSYLGDRYIWTGFSGFLTCYDRVASVFSSPDDLAGLVTAVLEQSRQNGVLYTEIFIKDDYANNDLGAWREIVAAMTSAAQDMETKRGIMCRFLPTVVRHRGPDVAEHTARFAADVAGNPHIVGLSMAGDERAFKPSEFIRAFDIAREAGLSSTCHAGEVVGAVSIKDTIDSINPRRIGHCVRCVEDKSLMSMIRDRNITAEVCPGANISLGLYPDWRSHPVTEMIRYGINVTISTDDPPFFGTSMTREYERLSTRCGLDNQEIYNTVLGAIDSALCREEEKEILRSRVLDHLPSDFLESPGASINV